MWTVLAGIGIQFEVLYIVISGKMLYGRYKCLKSTFQFILTDIGCDKEAVSFFESQGFFLIADRTFSFHDENAYEGSLVDLAEHFFDVLSVENELILR